MIESITNKLIVIRGNTIGSSFSINFSTWDNIWKAHFTSIHLSLENESLSILLELILVFILVNREIKSDRIGYTLMKFRGDNKDVEYLSTKFN